MDAGEVKSIAEPINPFILASKGKLTTLKQNNITRKIAQYIIMDMRSFSSAESEEFRSLIHGCEPR